MLLPYGVEALGKTDITCNIKADYACRLCDRVYFMIETVRHLYSLVIFEINSVILSKKFYDVHKIGGIFFEHF
jgi:hypothetical protein